MTSAPPRCSATRRDPWLVALLVLVPLLILAAPAPVHACSGYVCFDSELTPAQQAPANLLGGYWFPSSASGAEVEDDVHKRFQLFRIDGNEEVSVPVSIEQIGNSPRFFWKPKELLEPEATYRVLGPDYCNGDEPDSVTAHVFRTVQEAELPEGVGRLQSKSKKGDLTVSTASGACSTWIAADQVEILLVPTPEAEPWWDLFQLKTYVDGERWFYSRHLLGAGRSRINGYMRRGHDLIYAGCGSYDYKGLSEGTHLVEMKATLPGSDWEWVSQPLEIELNCDGVQASWEQDENLADQDWLVIVIFSPLLLVFGGGIWWGARRLWNLWKQ